MGRRWGDKLVSVTDGAADLALLCELAARQLGIESPEREHRFAHPEREWRFDFAWTDARLRVAVEREGATWIGGRHVRGAGYESDAEKYSEASIRGWVVVRATVSMIRDGRAFDLILRALRARLGSATPTRQ